MGLSKGQMHEMTSNLREILQEDLTSVIENLLSINLEMIDLKSIRFLRATSANLISKDKYRNFETALNLFKNLSSFDLHMMIDENFCSALTQENLDLIQKVGKSFESYSDSEFTFQSDFMDELGYFLKHVFLNPKGDKIGVIFVNFKEIQSDLNKELFYWDVMTMTETLGWNLVIVNLQETSSCQEIVESVLRLMSTLKI